jgi:hypothetical protein
MTSNPNDGNLIEMTPPALPTDFRRFGGAAGARTVCNHIGRPY